MTFTKGHKPTDKTRRKLSAAARGNKHSVGRVWTAESRAKLSAAMKGNKNSKGHVPSAEHRRKISEALKAKPPKPAGWQHTPETKAQIAASLEEHYCSTKTREKLRVAQRVIKLFKPEVHAKRAAMSAERMRAQNADPAYQERVRAGQRAYRERLREAA